MKQIFLAPRSNETAYANFKSTIADGISIERIKPYLSEEEIKIFGNQDLVFVWGNQASRTLRSSWEKMQYGDYVLFYAKGEFVVAGQVQFTKLSDKLALSLWPKSKDTGLPWSCVFFVTNLRKIDLPIEMLNEVTGYNMRLLRGFQRVSEEPLKKIVNAYGSVDQFIDTITIGLKSDELADLTNIAFKKEEKVSSEDLDKLDSIIGDKDLDEVILEVSLRNLDRTPEERVSLQKRIKRDYSLVRALKAKFNNKCQFCGFTFVTSKGNNYSEAAHIKAISSREKGVDTAPNILILCPNHHKMLDYGAIEIISSTEFKVDGKRININQPSDIND